MWRAFDHVLRFVYVLLAPAVIAALAGLLPVTGIVINAALATGVALAGAEHWQRRTRPIPFIGKSLAGLGRLGEYYDHNPVRPLLYYVLYPLFAPYWLFNREARRELFVYRRIGVIALVITVMASAVEYASLWRPLPFKYFAVAMVTTALMQLLITFLFVMPIVTTIIELHKRRRRGSVVTVIVVGLGFGLFMFGAMRSNGDVPLPTQQRMWARCVWQPAAAKETVDRAFAIVVADPHAVDAARHELERLFRSDEARAFRFMSESGVIAMFAPSRHGLYIWRARGPAGPIATVAQLPETIRVKFRTAPPTLTQWP